MHESKHLLLLALAIQDRDEMFLSTFVPTSTARAHISRLDRNQSRISNYTETPIDKMASSVDAKLLKATKFPAEFNQKVDMQKVNLEVMKKYVGSCLAFICSGD